MVFAMAEANVGSERVDEMLGAWSNLIVGEKPSGLVQCYLLRSETTWQVASIWEDRAAMDDAHREEAQHPAFVVFEAAGAEPVHTVLSVNGALHSHG